MGEKPINLGELLASLGETNSVSDEGAPLPPHQAEEMQQLAILFAELEREFGKSDDPDLHFAAAFARQCALGDLGMVD